MNRPLLSVLLAAGVALSSVSATAPAGADAPPSSNGRAKFTEPLVHAHRGASGYRPEELDAQLTWIEEQTGGRPYGVDLLIPEKFTAGDPGNLVASLRAQIPDEHLAFVRGLLDKYGVPARQAPPGRAAAGDRAEEFWASVSPAGAESLLDAASAKVTTEALTQMGKEVAIDQKDVKDVAAAFLKAQGL